MNITDPVFVLNFLFSGGREPSCFDACDVNDTDGLNITDPIALLGFLFSGDAPPAPPHPECGEDPTEDELDCETYDGCAQ